MSLQYIAAACLRIQHLRKTFWQKEGHGRKHKCKGEPTVIFASKEAFKIVHIWKVVWMFVWEDFTIIWFVWSDDKMVWSKVGLGLVGKFISDVICSIPNFPYYTAYSTAVVR